MATKYLCDKCDSSFDSRDKVRCVPYPKVDRHNYNEIQDSTVTKDLCAKCLGKLNEWMQPDAKQAAK